LLFSQVEEYKFMESQRTIKIGSELKGTAVLAADTGMKIGEAADALVEPLHGRLTGLVVRTHENVLRVLSEGEFTIGRDAIMASQSTALRPIEATGNRSESVTASELVGVRLVTEDGRLAGSIVDVHLVPQAGIILYRVAESTIQRFMGRGFFLSADVALAFSPDGNRIIVPSDLEERYASKSIDEIVETIILSFSLVRGRIRQSYGVGWSGLWSR
jgi:sporulation protein YlmC with PRC-barrel domain